MITFNAGLVQVIDGVEYELMSRNWHNPNFDIIATNIMIDGILNHVCYAKSVKGKGKDEEFITVYKYKRGENQHYYSRNYDMKSDSLYVLPTKYHDVALKLYKAFKSVDFTKLPNPKQNCSSSVVEIKTTGFNIVDDELRCDFMIRGINKQEFLVKLKEKASTNEVINHTLSPNRNVIIVKDVKFSTLRMALMQYMLSYKVTLCSGVNLNSISDVFMRNIVIETFKSIDLNNRQCS